MSDDLPRDVERGHQAQRLLDDALFREILDGLRAEYIRAWEASSPRDTDGRERLWQAYQIAGIIRSNLQSVANDGKLARAELEMITAKTKPNLSVA